MGKQLIGRPCSFVLSGGDRHGTIEHIGHSEALGLVVVVLCDDSRSQSLIDRCVLSGESAESALSSVGATA